MAQVWSATEQTWIPVRNLKNLKHSQHPEYSFFLHRAITPDVGWRVTEKTTGAVVVASEISAAEAVALFYTRLCYITKDQMSTAITKALLLIKNSTKETLSDENL